MNSTFERPLERGRLHDQVTRQLARRVIQGEQLESPVAFPNETDLAQQLGVSRTILRESMKVLVDKGMVEMRPKFGTRARPRSAWNLLDPDILAWQAEVHPDARFLRDLCEVRLAIEPTAAGFAAVRATEEEVSLIERCWRGRELQAQTGDYTGEEVIDLDLRFHTAVVAASHSPLLRQLSETIREPFRTALLCTSRVRSSVVLSIEANGELLRAIRAHDPLAARRAAEQAVGFAMLAAEEVVRADFAPKRKMAPQ
jgi:DNA-binding FadR family transcriptional regulator